MNIDILTIFPEIFDSFLAHGIVKRAIAGGKVSVSAVNIRDFAGGRHRVTDDRPYGGGCGMVMKPEPLAAAIRTAKRRSPDSTTILLTPQGKPFDQGMAGQLSGVGGLILVCGRYEGIDERIAGRFVDDEISIGDYVLTGGEVAAMVIADAVIRLIPGVLGGSESAIKESFSSGLLEHAHYTRPSIHEGAPVPEVLQSGNHKAIEKWRFETSLIRTFLKRRDLLQNRPMADEEIQVLRDWVREIERIIHDQSICCADPLSGGEQERLDSCVGNHEPGSA